MQEFGLDSLRSPKLAGVELAIAKEQATTLGLAGRKLTKAILQYQRDKTADFPNNNEAILLTHITEATYELLLQRELTGFIDSNMAWVLAHYTLPDDAITLLGISKEAVSMPTR